MALITKGRTELSCRNNIGGIKNVYLFNFVPLSITDYIINGAEITSFPVTQLYEFYTRDANFTENITNDEQGISYSQSLTFTMTKQNITTSKLLSSIKDLFFSYVLRFNDGSLRIGGLLKGASLEYTTNSGGAKSDANNYTITLTGIEEDSAPFLNNLDDFNVGVVYLLLENGIPLLTENNELIEIE